MSAKTVKIIILGITTLFLGAVYALSTYQYEQVQKNMRILEERKHDK